MNASLAHSALLSMPALEAAPLDQEHPFPAATDDAEAALRWALANAATLGGDQNHMAQAGDSAGAQLALA